MSSERYEELEDDFDIHIKEIENSVLKKLPKISGEVRKSELRNLEKIVEDADAELAQMFDEAQSAPGTYRTTLMSRSRGYKAQLDKLKKEYNKALQSSGSSGGPSAGGRNELVGQSGSQNQSNILQNRMSEGLASLDRGTQSLARSERIAQETDEIGVQIIGDLDEQRDTLVRTRDKLKETNADLSRSRRILATMGIKLMTNKLLLIVIIILELAIIGGIVYLKFIK